MANDLMFKPTITDEDGDDMFPRDSSSPEGSIDYAKLKAEKTHAALGDDSPGREELVSAKVSGSEGELRRVTTANEGMKSLVRKQELVRQYMEFRRSSKEGVPLTNDETQYLLNLTNDDTNDLISNPGSFFEKSYSKFVAKKTFEDSETYKKALLADPTNTQVLRRHTEGLIAKQEAFKDINDEVNLRWADAGVGSTVLNIAGVVTPFLSWYNTQSRASKNVSSFYQGSNIEEQIRNIYLMPTDQAILAARNAIEDIGSRSKLDAVKFAQALISYTDFDQGLDDLFSGLDLGTSGLGTALIALGKRTISAAKGPGVVDNSAASVVNGDIKGAVQADLIKQFEKEADTVRGSINSLGEIKKDTASIFDVDSLFTTNNPNIALSHGSRVKEILEANAQNLLRASFSDPLNIRTLEGNSLVNAITKAQDSVAKTYPNLPDTIVSVSTRLNSDTGFGFDQVSILFGKHDGTLFSDADTANMIARHVFNMPDGGWNVMQVGDKFGIEVVKNVDESLVSIRNSLKFDLENDATSSLVNVFLGSLRGTDYVMPKALAQAMKTATYGGNVMFEAIKSVGKNVSDMPKENKKAFKEFVSAQQTFVDPSKPTKVGKFSDNLGEFSVDWYNHHKRAPTEKETLAYFSYRQLNDIEFVVNNLSKHRDKSRQGLMNHRVKLDGVYSAKIEGKQVDEIPWEAKGHAGILVTDGTSEGSRVFSKLYTNSDTRESINRMVREEGYVITQVSGREARGALRSTPGMDAILNGRANVSFIVSKGVERSPLDFNQIPFAPGGHIIYTQGNFIKQGKVRKVNNPGGVEEHVYGGDTSIFNFKTFGQARKFAKVMDDARIAFQKFGSTPELRRFVTTKLPMEYSDFTRMFSESGPLDINQPIVATRPGQNSDDVLNYSARYQNFVRESDSPFDLHRDINERFTMERGTVLNTIVEGTETNPLMHTRTADIVDPITAMDRAAQVMYKGRHLDNVKAKMATEFGVKFKDVLDLSDPRFSNNEMAALLEAPINWKADPKLGALARNYRRRAKEFLGEKSTENKIIDNMRWSIADSIYERFGQKASERIPDYLLAVEKDPVVFLRSVAFHSKLGLLNPIQLIQQAQAFVNAASLTNPIRGSAAAGAAMAMRYADVNPSMLKHLAERARFTGWDPDHFVESYNAMKASGFDIVGRETAQLDNYFDAPVTTTRFGKALDAGIFFFREGERFARMTSWNAAYAEWKATSGGKPLTNAVAQSILNRADIFAGNMSRASSSSWQRGAISIPTQFMSYPVRLMEQFLTFGGNKVLTPTEKLKLFTGMSLAYGVPIAASGVTGLWPIHENIHRALIENNIDAEESLVHKALTDGFGNLAVQLITGEDNNFGERMGPAAIPLFRDLMRGDKSIVEMFSGPSGSTLGEAAATGLPIPAAIVHMFTGEKGWHELLEDDLLKFASTISSVNQGRNAWNAIFLNSFISKTGTKITRQGEWEGVINSLIGTSPSAVTDVFRGIEMERDLKIHQSSVTKEIVRLNDRLIRETDPDLRAGLMRRIRFEWIRGGFRPDQIPGTLRRMGSSQQFLDDIQTGRAMKNATTPEEIQAIMKRVRRKQPNASEAN